MNLRGITVSFFGHRRINNTSDLEYKLEGIISELILHNEYVEFLVGRNGDFDTIVSSVIRRCKRAIRDDNSALVLVLPYSTAEYRDNKVAFSEYYDEIEICDFSSDMYFKAAYQARNRTMVDRSDIVFFYVEHSFGGAYMTMRYADQIGVKCVNIT